MDLSKEDSRIVERYGTGTEKFQADGAPKMTENFLIARRLVEAGARVVSLATGEETIYQKPEPPANEPPPSSMPVAR